jgi:branched-chain amino acid transport system ATP-binding protein
MSALLSLDHVSRRFSGLLALDDVSVSLKQGEIVGLIGPNGAGKTTFVNVISGVLKPTSGSVDFLGRSIGGLRPDLVARAGIARTFQIVQPFPRMTVRENVAAAALFAGSVPTRDEAKSLASKPKLLLLDEVNAGLNAAEIDDALRLISEIAGRGITVLLIEHLMKVVSQSCSRLLVLHQGRLIADGQTASVMQDQQVIEAYLGQRYARLKQESAI